MQPIHVRVLGWQGAQTLFIDVKDLYPECLGFIAQHPKLSPLICFQNDNCTVGRLCLENIHKRVWSLFGVFPHVAQLVCKFGIEGRVDPTQHTQGHLTRVKPRQKHRAVAFFSDNSTPRYISFNSFAYDRMRGRGTLYRVDTAQLGWYLPDSPVLSCGHPSSPEKEAKT